MESHKGVCSWCWSGLCARPFQGVRPGISDNGSPWLFVYSFAKDSKNIAGVPKVGDQPQKDGNPATVWLTVVVGGRRVGDGGVGREDGQEELRIPS